MKCSDITFLLDVELSARLLIAYEFLVGHAVRWQRAGSDEGITPEPEKTKPR